MAEVACDLFTVAFGRWKFATQSASCSSALTAMMCCRMKRRPYNKLRSILLGKRDLGAYDGLCIYLQSPVCLSIQL